ncbi:hypothetical protein Bca52824_035084 [Brassica carinata]|uniref:Uncharacterized protein n=1 Tax=Brassica carinata TaxID=52824 RepID=A0A8X7S2H9_BRACI|nr:hypothetical protein Bca52824_035084 [Brassica carinata]
MNTDTTVCLSVFEGLARLLKKLNRLVFSSGSSVKDTVLAEEGELSKARRGSNAAMEEKRKISSGSDH